MLVRARAHPLLNTEYHSGDPAVRTCRSAPLPTNSELRSHELTHRTTFGVPARRARARAAAALPAQERDRLLPLTPSVIWGAGRSLTTPHPMTCVLYLDARRRSDRFEPRQHRACSGVSDDQDPTLIGTGRRTTYDWTTRWNTTTVPNGTSRRATSVGAHPVVEHLEHGLIPLLHETQLHKPHVRLLHCDGNVHNEGAPGQEGADV